MPEHARARALALRWAPSVVWMGVIFAFSSVPGSNLPGGYSFQGHFAEYAVLGALVTMALVRGPAGPRWVLLAIAACSLYGVTDELHQAFVPGRTPDVLDWATDTLGAGAGATAAASWLKWRAGGR
jgi:VanZ family protein